MGLQASLELAKYLLQLLAEPCILAVFRGCIHAPTRLQSLVARLNQIARQIGFAARR